MGTVCLLFLFSLAACNNGSPDTSEARKAATLRVVLQEEPANLDPVRANDVSAMALSRQVFQAPLRYKYLSREIELRPDLALRLPEISEDLLTYTLRINPKARFAPDLSIPGGAGREVTAADVAYSLKRHFDPAQRSAWRWMFQNLIQGLDQWGENPDYDRDVAGLEIVDEFTLRIHLSRPNPVFPHALASGGAGVVPREAVEHYGEGFGRRPVGSGPYRLIELDNTGARFVRNSAFADVLDLAAEGGMLALHELSGLNALDGRSLPFMDEIQASFVVDNISAFLLFSESPPTDIGLVATEAVDLWQRNPPVNHRLATYPSLSVVRFGLNLDGPLGTPTSDRTAEDLRALRCAMGRAMDWEERNRIFYHGTARMHPGIIPPGMDGFDADLDLSPVSHDRLAARDALTRHGWNDSNLPEIVYGHQSGSLQRQGYEHFRAMLVAIGWPEERIRSRVYSSFGDLSRGAIAGDMDVYLRSWVLDYPDAENVLALYYGPNAPGTNFERYRRAAYDRAFERIISMSPSHDRTEQMRQMNAMLIEDCVFMGSVFRTASRGIHRDLIYRGDTPSPLAGLAWRFAIRRPAN